MDILQKVKTSLVYFDGAMGTSLQAMGLPDGEQPEKWNIENPEAIISVHRQFLEAGCNVITTNTFGANALKFDGSGYSVEKIIAAAVENARQAIKQTDYLGTDRYIAFDLGPSGKLLEPLGEMTFEEAVELFAEEIRCAEKSGVDLIVIETMNDSYEAKAAMLAAKENCSLPVFCTTVFDENGKLMTGADPKAVIALLEGLGADAVGMNCSLGPEQMAKLMPIFAEYASVPIIVNPNAGLPRVENGKTVFSVTPEAFAATLADIVRGGARIVGGCCGTTPEHIRALVEATRGITPLTLSEKNITVISSYTHTVEFGDKPVLIGERINPTGKPKLKAALREDNMDYILGEGFSQRDRGAKVLDVNVGLPEIDEPKLLCEAVRKLQSVIDLPLQLDTSDIAAMESALRIYNGKPLVNSVNGKKESMEAVFPLVKKYGGAVIALTLDESGIPDSARGRAAIAKKIISTAAKYGISNKDIIVDPLALAISSDTSAATVTLEAIKLIKGLGVCTSLGVSNVSFGLPDREAINSAFFAMALLSGLDAAIMNPYSRDMLKTYHSFCALSNKDESCREFIAFAEQSQMTADSADKGGKPESEGNGDKSPLQDAIYKGIKDLAGTLAKEMLSTLTAKQLIEGHIIPALDTVGKAFESNRVFLPQLLMSAEAAKAAFAAAQATLKAGEHGAQKGKIILATVKGDIHDIGKNIVKVMLENYGFEVIDLGRDVSPEAVVEAAVSGSVSLVGLSALMTTTVGSMQETIRRLKSAKPDCITVVGGAVLTQEYADMIGADYYAKDAMETVRIAEKTFN